MQTINVIPDMPDWMTSSEAAAKLGKNLRTVQEYAKDGRIKSKSAGNKSKPNQRVYSGADVAKLISNPPPETRGAPGKLKPHLTSAAKERRALAVQNQHGSVGQFLAFIRQQQDADREHRRVEQQIAADRRRAELEAEQKLRAAELAMRQEAARQQAERAEREARLNKPWLTLRDAAELSGLPRAALLEMAETGKITASNSGGWRLQRASLLATFEGEPRPTLHKSIVRKAHA